MKYYTQIQAPAGNWVDVLGSDDVTSCRMFAKYRRELGDTVRVIERKDKVV